MKKKERVKDPDKTKKRDNIFTIILSICDVVAVVVLFLLYGPFNGFRDWLVTTAMRDRKSTRLNSSHIL